MEPVNKKIWTKKNTNIRINVLANLISNIMLFIYKYYIMYNYDIYILTTHVASPSHSILLLHATSVLDETKHIKSAAIPI